MLIINYLNLKISAKSIEQIKITSFIELLNIVKYGFKANFCCIKVLLKTAIANDEDCISYQYRNDVTVSKERRSQLFLKKESCG